MGPGIGSLFHHPRWRGEAKPIESPFKRNTFFNLHSNFLSISNLLGNSSSRSTNDGCHNRFKLLLQQWQRCDVSVQQQLQRVVENQVSTNHSILGSGWFYSGYSGFHPNFKKIQKIRKERKRKETKLMKTKYFN